MRVGLSFLSCKPKVMLLMAIYSLLKVARVKSPIRRRPIWGYSVCMKKLHKKY